MHMRRVRRIARTPPPSPPRQAKCRRNNRTSGRGRRRRRRLHLVAAAVADSRVRRGRIPPDTVAAGPHRRARQTRGPQTIPGFFRPAIPLGRPDGTRFYAVRNMGRVVCVAVLVCSVQWGAHMSNPSPSVADAVAAVAAAHVRAGVPWRSARPVRRPSPRGAVAAAAVRCGAAVADANRDGPIHDAGSADRPAYTAGLRHTSCVDWAAVAARLAARFPLGHDARSEFDGFVDATMIVESANGASVCIPDPDYRGGLI